MSWNLNETDPAALRKAFTVFDNNGALADVCVPAVGELKTAKNALGVVNAAGSLTRIGQGAFYYAGLAGDADTEGVFFIFVVKAGFTTAVAYTRVVGNSGKIWIPIQLWNNGAVATGIVPNVGAGELQISNDGVAWAAATGTFVEIAYGAYLYAHDVANVTGFLGLKVSGAAVDTEIAWGSVEGGIVTPPPAPVGIGSLGTGKLAGIGYWSV